MRISILFSILFLVASSSYAGQGNEVGPDGRCLSNPLHMPFCHGGAGQDPSDVKQHCNSVTGAINGHFKPKTNKDHPDLVGACKNTALLIDIEVYPCNAGLKHVAPNSKICTDLTSGLNVLNCDGINNCRCSDGPSLINQEEFDYFSFGIANYNDTLFLDGTPVQNLTNFSSLNKISSSTSNYSVASNNQAMHVLSDEPRLTFKLGSERLGAKYFADICWRIKGEDKAQEVEYKVNSKIFMLGAYPAGSTYIDQSNLESKIGLFCSGMQKDNQGNEVFNFIAPTQGSNGYYGSLPFTSGTRETEDTFKNMNACFYRYMFDEVEKDAARKWEQQEVTFQVDIEVTPKEELPVQNPLGEAFSLCKVTSLKANQYSCKTINYINTAVFKADIGLGLWDNVSNKSYYGACQIEGPCPKPN